MLIAVSAMHGRHAISEAWAEHTSSLGFDAVYVSVTTSDDVNFEICERHGFNAVYMDNDPLAEKFNTALSLAMSTPFERVMVLPSDDFISTAWIHAARTSPVDYMIPHECAIVDAATQHAFKIVERQPWIKYGAGRVVSRRVVDKLSGELWPVHLTKGLDSGSHTRIVDAGFACHVVKTDGMPITDVKTEGNLWPFTTWRPGSRPISADDALHMVSPSVRAKLDALKIQ